MVVDQPITDPISGPSFVFTFTFGPELDNIRSFFISRMSFYSIGYYIRKKIRSGLNQGIMSCANVVVFCLPLLPPSDYWWIITEHVKVIKYVEDALSIVLWTRDGAGYEQWVFVPLTFCIRDMWQSDVAMTQLRHETLSWVKTVAEVCGAHILVWLPSSRLPSHWDWWRHSVGYHPEPHHMSSCVEE